MERPFLELDTRVSDEARTWQLKAREFAREVLTPVGHELDLMSAEDAVAPGSPYFTFMRLAAEGGWLRMSAPTEFGGPGLSRLEEYLVMEELSAGDAGLAATIFVAPFAFSAVHQFGSPRLVEELSRPFFTGERTDWFSCWAITEMDHGSDSLAPHTPALTVPGGQTVVRIEGDECVVNGSKSNWVGGAVTASHALLFCTVDNETMDRGAVVVVPLDHPGVTRGAPLDKLGMRSINQTSITFTDVRLPVDHMLAGPDAYRDVLHATHSLASTSTAPMAFGIGRAAYEGALQYAQDRVQGGKPLSEHQATQLRLFRMFTQLEAARAFARATYLYNYGRADSGQTGSLAHSCASKVFTTEAVFEVCDSAMQLCGGRGTMKQGVQLSDGRVFHPEKLFRDAKSMKIADGENVFLSLIGGVNLL